MLGSGPSRRHGPGRDPPAPSGAWSMIGVILVRRFRIDGGLVLLSHLAELPALPPKGWHIDYNDESGIGVVAWGQVKLRDFSPGAYGPRVTVYMDSEAAERMPAAQAAGWKLAEGV